MGEVWRARDTRLGREVALKVLPAAFMGDATRVARFEREARLLAALNHPAIATVHGFERVDGVSLLVLELVGGPTLAERLRRGRLPVRQAMKIAAYIAEALEAAHGKGIVHRDLKPSNVKLLHDERVKLLDFGLAKTFRDEPSGEDSALSTETSPGVILGTAPYMSPEQLRGELVDQRSDMWAFGCVLYEMLSGRRAFTGATSSDLVAAILEREPDWSAVPSVTPTLARAVLARCLKKDRAERLRDGGDARIVLEDAIAEVAESSGAVRRSGRWYSWRGAFFAAALMAVGAAGVLAVRRPAVGLPRYTLLTARPGIIASARFMPDGQTVLYSASWDAGPAQIYMTRPESLESKSLGLPPGNVLSVSSKGELAVLLTRDRNPISPSGTLARVTIAGGTPRPLLEDAMDADWGPDGEELCVLRNVSGRPQIEFPIGNVLVREATQSPRVSPRGDLVAYRVMMGIEVVNRAGERRRLANTPSGILPGSLAWSPSGDEVWFTAGDSALERALWAVTPTGKQRLLARTAGSLNLWDVAAGGRALVNDGFGRAGIRVRRPQESSERDLLAYPRGWLVGISADGENVLTQEWPNARVPGHLPRPVAAHLLRTDGSSALRLGEGRPVGLAPDGRSALIVRGLGKDRRLVQVPIGPGEPISLDLNGMEVEHDCMAHWSNDGSRLFYAFQRPGSDSAIFVRKGQSGWRAVLPFDRLEQGDAPDFIVSPDGAAIASAGRSGFVTVFPVDGGAPRALSGIRGAPVHWTAQGDALYVRRPNPDFPAIIDRVDLTNLRVTPLLELLPPDPAGVIYIGTISFTPDGRGYVYEYNRWRSDLWLVEGLR